MNIKAAIFDMDGTLVDSLMVWGYLWKEFGKKYLEGKEFIPEPAIDKAIRTLPLKDAMNLIYEHYHFGENGSDLLNTANELMATFYKEDVKVKKDVHQFLTQLQNNGVKMCIASATAPDLVNIALDACDLRKYFLKFFSCADLGLGKDKPDIFNLALEFLGTEKAETYVFEDSPVAVDTAMKASFPTVAIYDKYNEGSENLKNIATYFISENESLMKLIKEC